MEHLVLLVNLDILMKNHNALIVMFQINIIFHKINVNNAIQVVKGVMEIQIVIV